MEQLQPLQPWITPALVLGLFAWVRLLFVDLKENMNRRIDDLKRDVNTRFAETNQRVADLANDMNRRFDEVNRELAENRERMAKLEGSLEGFLAGRRDRNAA